MRSETRLNYSEVVNHEDMTFNVGKLDKFVDQSFRKTQNQFRKSNKDLSKTQVREWLKSQKSFFKNNLEQEKNNLEFDDDNWKKADYDEYFESEQLKRQSKEKLEVQRVSLKPLIKKTITKSIDFRKQLIENP